MMFPAPPIPAFAPGQFADNTFHFRYEDVTQDGRVIVFAVPAVLPPMWREVLVDLPGARNALQIGILPILTRLTLCTMDQPIRVDLEVRSHTGFAIARDPVQSRVFMNIWSEVRGVAGKLGRNPTAGELSLAGTLFAEHTFTRPLAPPDQRRVTSLDVEGYPEPGHYVAPAPATAQEPPAGAHWLDELAPDATDYAFSLDQTDPNQHVNSLVYIRLFIEASNRRIAAAGRPMRMRCRAVDIAYRRPSFAGDRVRANLRLFEHDGTLGTAGFITGPDDKPRCYVRMLFGA